MKKPRRSLTAVLLAMLALFLAQDAWASAEVAKAIQLPEDPSNAYITLGILVVAAIMFFTEVVPLACTAILVPVALSLCGVLDNKTAFSHWGNPTVILFMAMFIVGEATFVTGFADKIGALAMRLSKGKPRLLLLFSMVAVGSLSTVLSDTGTTVVAMPMIMAMCVKARMTPARI